MRVSDSALRRLAWVSAVFMVLGTTAGVFFAVAADRFDTMMFALLMTPFPIVGFFVILKRPRSTLGWLMFSMGYGIALPLEPYAHYALEVRGGSLPGGPLALAFAGPSWIPFFAIAGFLLLLFPDGHLPSPRWRWFARVCGVGLGICALCILLYPGDGSDFGLTGVQNPLGIEALKPVLGVALVLAILAPILMLGGATGVVLRLRRTRDDIERHQLRVLAYAASIVAVMYALAFLGSSSWGTSWIQIIGASAIVLIPIAIGIAIFKYRLYDIDVVIRKTVVFGLLAVFITVVYAGIVAAASTLFSGSEVGSFVAAAVLAVVFAPARDRARRIADRVIYGKRATPYEVLAEFSQRVGTAYADEDVLERMAKVLEEGTGASGARVFLQVGKELRAVASVGEQGSETTVAVTHQGQELGALAVSMPPSDPMNPAKHQLVEDLAAQAGLVLRNVKLIEELKASRQRLVSAQDQERRKIERDLHDGVQQQLVALNVQLGLLPKIAAKDPAKVGEISQGLQAQATEALEDLRDLARGIYPPLLADQGLGPALEAQARKAAVPTSVQTDGIGRYDQATESAIYFCALEALNNVAKYAHATSATISLAQTDGHLSFSVTDDGQGFDTAQTPYGTGLQGMADRLDAIGGALTVESTPGRGTTVAGAIARPRGDSSRTSWVHA